MYQHTKPHNHEGYTSPFFYNKHNNKKMITQWHISILLADMHIDSGYLVVVDPNRNWKETITRDLYTKCTTVLCDKASMYEISRKCYTEEIRQGSSAITATCYACIVYVRRNVCMPCNDVTCQF